MKSTFELLREAKVAPASIYVLNRDGFRSAAFWRQVELEINRMKKVEMASRREANASKLDWLTTA